MRVGLYCVDYGEQYSQYLFLLQNTNRLQSFIPVLYEALL